MAQVSVNYPVVGQANSTEDPKVVTALQALVTAINALDDANIASGANINGSKLLNSSIETGKLADNAVTTAKIANSQVTSAKIADGAIATADIANSAVTSAKIADGTIATGDIANSAVTSDKIANGAVTSAKIADGTITGADIATSSIGADKFAASYAENAIGADTALTQGQWNAVVQVTPPVSGIYVVLASGAFGGQNSNNVLWKIQSSGGVQTYGLLTNANPYGQFAHHGIGISYGNPFILYGYSYSGKQYAGAGTRISVFRIG